MTSIKAPVPTTPRCARPIPDYDDGDLAAPNFVDHFSIRRPSSTVKFRGARVHVYEAGDEQILLEDRLSSTDYVGDESDDDDNGKSRPRRHYRHNITVKRMPMSTFGLIALRMAYTLISLLLFSYIFAFCFQIVIFLFVNLFVDAQLNPNEDFIVAFRFVASILSVPTFVIGFSSLMSIATTFVYEAWTGGRLIRIVIGAPGILQEFIYFVFFILTPAITFVYGLFDRREDPWKLTCQAWLISVLSIFIIFVLALAYREIRACFRLTCLYSGELSGESGLKKFFVQAKRAILTVQTLRYSGHRREQYLVTGDDLEPEKGYIRSDEYKPTSVQQSWYSSMTELCLFKCIFDTIDPKRIYSVEEVREMLPFITENSWSLETMFCSNTRKRRVIAAKGPDGVKPSQVMSSFVCNVLGTVIITLFVVGYFYWLDTGIKTYISIGVLSFICCLYPLLQSNIRMLKMYSDLNKTKLSKNDEEASGEDAHEDEDEDDDGSDDDDEEEHDEVAKEKTTMFRLWETIRVTQPKAWVCYTMMVLECVLLFIIPTVALFLVGNYPIGVIFVVLSGVGFIRNYFDAAAILCELGTLNDVDIRKETEKEKRKGFFPTIVSIYDGNDKTLVLKARLAEIIGNISRSDSVTRWMWFFGILIFGIFLLYGWAITSDDGLGDRRPIVFVDDYAYVAEQSLQYPTCTINKGFSFTLDGMELDASLADFSFVSMLAYETTNVTSYILPQWFGEGKAVDEDELVKKFRAEENNDDVPVFFKFFTFPDLPDAGVVAIRGSQTGTDWLTNMQIWSASGLAQIMKWLTPFGWIWTPVLDTLVSIIGYVQSQQLEAVSYYKVTTDFINKFKETYPAMSITGASLGGGLALISGAQARIPTVAISGLGAELARHTLVPPITLDDINKYNFNWIPDRDYIARLGGRPRHHQEGQCEAPTSSLDGCHSMIRSFCEINYRCGSNGRPVLCVCHFEYDFPEPEPVGNTTRSFTEACIESQQAFLDATGSKISVEYL